ncbi:hypothetical protein ACIQWA_10795 [Kitasatospora sp. NPDC098652]|uniref:hypothetical protein n=1 Tax=Kitasatospora sp. NPDC098652 TaxID=3364095 RepID=UPI00382D607F
MPGSSCYGTLDERALRALMVDNEDVEAAQGPLLTDHLDNFGRLLGSCGIKQGGHQLVNVLVNQDEGYPEPPSPDLPVPKQMPSLRLESVSFAHDYDRHGNFVAEGTRVYFRCWSQPHEADHFSVPVFLRVIVLGRAAGYGDDQEQLTPHQRRVLADAALALAKALSTELRCDAGVRLPAEPPADSYGLPTADWLSTPR